MFLATHGLGRIKMGILCCFLLCFISIANAVSIVFVHIGKTLPPYLEESIAQARFFNKECPIYLIANNEALKHAKKNLGVYMISYEDLKKSSQHKKFKKSSPLNRDFRGGFVFFATERFFVLDDFMKQYQIKDLFHLESDVMLYADLKNLAPFFKGLYRGMIAATFDNDKRCIPGILYISESKPLDKLTEFIAETKAPNDMEYLSKFKDKYHHTYVDYLPIVMPSVGLKSVYSNNYEVLASVFDAAALGQYLGGIDPRNPGASGKGFINESCVFNPANFEFIWENDSEGRRVPYLFYRGEKCRINNLHIHSKNLKQFLSR